MAEMSSFRLCALPGSYVLAGCPANEAYISDIMDYRRDLQGKNTQHMYRPTLCSLARTYVWNDNEATFAGRLVLSRKKKRVKRNGWLTASAEARGVLVKVNRVYILGAWGIRCS